MLTELTTQQEQLQIFSARHTIKIVPAVAKLTLFELISSQFTMRVGFNRGSLVSQRTVDCAPERPDPTITTKKVY
jgi:hypothetical protein